MQGINKTKYALLAEALLQLERLLNDNHENEEAQQTLEYRKELDTMFGDYERLLKELAEQISAYEELYIKIKTQYLSKKLKELKKEIPAGQPAFLMLLENIRLVYGT